MPSGTTIANAYVQILPSAEGIKNNLAKELGGGGEDIGKGIASKIGGGLKTGLGVAAKAAVAGIAAAGTAAVALGKQAMDSYADYEQQRWQPSFGRYFTLNVGVKLNGKSDRKFGR